MHTHRILFYFKRGKNLKHATMSMSLEDICSEEPGSTRMESTLLLS